MTPQKQSHARDFIDLDDIAAAELKRILDHAKKLKAYKFNPPQLFSGLSLMMLFDKRSTRTRVSFEVAMKQLGGHTIVMNADDMQLTGSENIEDTARVLSRFVDAIMVRMSDDKTLRELAKYATVPVINGLTNYSHPCQIMADIMTIEEVYGGITARKIAWFGDYNNVARTFVQAADKLDFELTIATPKALKPDLAGRKNSRWTEDAAEAAAGAEVLVTDTWVSMGQEGKSIEMFAPYQVNEALMARANPNAIFMHCMPIHRGEEVTDAVLATPQSMIYDEAENRLHAQKAILAWCLENTPVTIPSR